MSSAGIIDSQLVWVARQILVLVGSKHMGLRYSHGNQLWHNLEGIMDLNI